MMLVMLVLLCVAALALVVRIIDSRSAVGFALLGLLLVFVSGQVAWRFSAHADGPNVAQAASEDRVEADTPEDGSVVSTSSSDEPASDDEDAEAGDEEFAIQIKTDQVVIPPRPEEVAKWIESDDVRTGPVHTTAVSTEPQNNERECRRALDEELMKAVDEYVDEYLGGMCAEKLKASSLVGYEVEYIKKEMVRPENIYHEEIQYSVGPMHHMHALVEFDDAFRQGLDQRWRERSALVRMMGTALAFGFVLALLGVVFGYFRVDTATRGYYTGRLQFSATMVILSLIVAGVFLARQILW